MHFPLGYFKCVHFNIRVLSISHAEKIGYPLYHIVIAYTELCYIYGITIKVKMKNETIRLHILQKYIVDSIFLLNTNLAHKTFVQNRHKYIHMFRIPKSAFNHKATLT